MITALDHIAIAVPDLEAAVASTDEGLGNDANRITK